MRYDFWVMAFGSLFAVLVGFRLGMIYARAETLGIAEAQRESIEAQAHAAGVAAVQCVGGFKVQTAAR